ncbi:hypothetical protein JB92DRAFT_3097556 [Gautieria morchelliformis]|nr:hypothetical protein JB92DRAFT_3097556 [Gautieria morchelliformis]
MSNNSAGVYATEFHELVKTNYIGIAGLAILLYDHLITFDDEIKYIWRGSKKPGDDLTCHMGNTTNTRFPVIWLFLINRYLTPLGFAVNINAYTSSAWSDEGPYIHMIHQLNNGFFSCRHFVVYEGIMVFAGVAIASLMMAFRVVAVYQGNRHVLALISFLFLAMVGIHIWLLTTTGPVIHPGIHGCSMLFGQGSHRIGGWVSATAWSPLVYDTAVVILIVLRTQYIVRSKVAGRVVTTLIRDGLLYFSVIVAVNIVLAVMIVRAPDGLKNSSAQFQLLMTVTMMSRITLNLRANTDPDQANGFNSTISTFIGPPDIPLQSFEAPPRAIVKRGPGQKGHEYVSSYAAMGTV